MTDRRMPLVAVFFVVLVLAVTACDGATAKHGASSTLETSGARVSTQPTPGAVTPTGPVWMRTSVGNMMVTVYSAQAYLGYWNAPSYVSGEWHNMGPGHMAVVLELSAQIIPTPPNSVTDAPAGPPDCTTLRVGMGMKGPRIRGQFGGGWPPSMQLGLYRGTMAFMVPASAHQLTLVCTDQYTGDRASWNIGF